jgi:hypothetical protein
VTLCVKVATTFLGALYRVSSLHIKNAAWASSRAPIVAGNVRTFTGVNKMNLKLIPKFCYLVEKFKNQDIFLSCD